MKKTDIGLRAQVMYSVFVRNHTQEGTFAALEKDLDRIRELGTDIVWLMPIHPIGEKQRKGKDGSPYAIKDYRAINPEYGTMEDFKHLVNSIHEKGMKCIIDVVYNHTSPDSWLVEHHPEFFYEKPEGGRGNKVGDWYDVVDLDYHNRELWDYQIETLRMWAEIVDGFRCDVAPLVPLAFWLAAREAVEEVRPGCIWLSESVEPGFIMELRNRGFTALSDSEIYQAFDIAYDYDIEDIKKAYQKGSLPLQAYVEALKRQEWTYPADYVKLHYLENHDQDRAYERVPNEANLRNWTAFLYCQKGMTLLYGGQEKVSGHRPDLFNTDRVEWNTGRDMTALLQRLYSIKKKRILQEGVYGLEAVKDSNTVVVSYQNSHQNSGQDSAQDVAGEKSGLLGIFSLDSRPAVVDAPAWLPDGSYRNLLDDREVIVRYGCLRTEGEPVILEWQA